MVSHVERRPIQRTYPSTELNGRIATQIVGTEGYEDTDDDEKQQQSKTNSYMLQTLK